MSDIAVNSAQGKRHFKIAFLSLTSIQACLIALALVAIFFASGALTATASSSISSYALGLGRGSIIDGFFGATWSVQSEERLGQVQQMLTVNAERIGLIVLGLAVGLQALLNIVALLIAAFIVNPLSAAGVLVAGTALFLMLRPFNTWTRRAAGQMAEDNRHMATMTTEYTRLIREFRLFGVEGRATDRLHQVNEIAVRSVQRTRRLSQILPTVYSTAGLLFVVVGLVVLSDRRATNLASVGAVLLLILRSLAYGAQVQGISQQFREYGAFVDDLRAQLDTYERSPEAVRDIVPPDTFNLSCDRLSFSYDGRTSVLKEVTFNVSNGNIVGIIGQSGSGKTTLAQLLLGLREPTEGEILVGSVRPGHLQLTGGVSPIALVAQDPVLLQGSIEFNVAFLRDVSIIQVEEACKAAHLHDDIMNMPDGYNTSVGEGGGSLSGGQRQRLAIARALVGRPRLLILDEPTSALDGRSESLIRRTLDELRGQMTVVIISHRLVTVEVCDSLLVLEAGHLVDDGPTDRVRRGAAFQRVTEMVARTQELRNG